MGEGLQIFVGWLDVFFALGQLKCFHDSDGGGGGGEEWPRG